MCPNKTIYLFLIAFSFLLLNVSPLAADQVYFKNGFRTEGEVIRTEEGLWINGALFQEDEIEHIEKTIESAPEPEKKGWYEGLFSGFGKKEEVAPVQNSEPSVEQKRQQSLQAYRERMRRGGEERAVQPGRPVMFTPGLIPQHPLSVPAQGSPMPAGTQQPAATQQPALNPIQALIPGQNPNKVDYMQDSLNRYQDTMTSYSAIINQATQLQQQANQRQLMIEEEVRRAEEGYDEGSYPQEMLPPADYEAQEREYEREQQRRDEETTTYEEKDRSKSPFQSMKIHPDGSATWE